MMMVTVDLDGELEKWARQQSNISEIVKLAIKAYMEHTQTPFEIALAEFRKNLSAVPADFEFEVPQIVGSECWKNLDWGSRLSFGRYISANQEACGVIFLRTTQSRHAVYKRAPNTPPNLPETIQENIPRNLIEPPLTTSFNEVYTAIGNQPNQITPQLQTTRGVLFTARASITRDGRRFISLPHNNRIYEGDWGFTTNAMGRRHGQRIGHYSVPLDSFALERHGKESANLRDME